MDYVELTGSTQLRVPGYSGAIQSLSNGATQLLTHQPPLRPLSGTVEFGVITSFAYKLEDGSGEIVVATTRCARYQRAVLRGVHVTAQNVRLRIRSPETMLGDTAVAIHPDDPRCEVGAPETLMCMCA